MEIRTYQPTDWPALRGFIHGHWRADHPYTDRALFDWQFAGFGPSSGSASKVIADAGRIVGFLGGIPGEYWVIDRVVPGVVFDLWFVHPDLRNAGVGLLMMKELEEEFEASCCLGINLDVVKYYTGRGYGYGASLHRWVVPLRADGFRRLVLAGARHVAGGGQVADWDPRPSGRPLQPLADVDPSELRRLYERTVEPVMRFAVHRSDEYWPWRYLRAVGFKYLFFGSPVESGFVVARVEQVISPEQPELGRMRVLRIIELLPARPETWRGEPDHAHAALIQGVLTWAVGQGCVLADYQCSSDRLAGVLDAAGLTRLSPGAAAALKAVPNLFQPLRRDARPINYVWRVNGTTQGDGGLDRRDIYLVKSDDGMDRPNVWPMPRGYS
jgi:GNAT superfamily N-acetyltransferase